MQKHIDDMWSPRIQAEDLAIESVRKPGHRMPVGGVRSAKGPNHGIPREAGTNLRIFVNVSAVVKIQKWGAKDRAVKRERCQSQQKADNQSVFFRELKNRRRSRARTGLRRGRIHGH